MKQVNLCHMAPSPPPLQTGCDNHTTPFKIILSQYKSVDPKKTLELYLDNIPIKYCINIVTRQKCGVIGTIKLIIQNNKSKKHC